MKEKKTMSKEKVMDILKAAGIGAAIALAIYEIADCSYRAGRYSGSLDGTRYMGQWINGEFPEVADVLNKAVAEHPEKYAKETIQKYCH